MTKLVQICIWCKRPARRASLEHILPDSLGCPPGFWLQDCVCMACNNGLGHVDQALLREFEIIAFIHGVPRKGGKPPAINSWSAIRGRYGPNGPELCLNAGPQMVEAWGANLRAASPRNGIESVTAGPMIAGQEGEVKFNQRFGSDPKFRRAVHKVALGSLAYYLGANAALQDGYDPVRAFVREGIGEFDVLMMPGDLGNRHYFKYPVVPFNLRHPIIEMGVFGVSFAVDMDPEQRGLQRLSADLTERKVGNWMILPRVSR